VHGGFVGTDLDLNLRFTLNLDLRLGDPLAASGLGPDVRPDLRLARDRRS